MSRLNVSPYVFPGIKNQDEVKKIKKFKRDRITIDDVLSIVAKNCCVTVNEITSRIRKREVIDARFIYIYMLRYEFYYGLKQIGNILGRDHTTIMHAVQTHRERYHQYSDYKEVSDGIQEEIKKIIE
jgi:chromosomal replication initiation ATPase DnaA